MSAYIFLSSFSSRPIDLTWVVCHSASINMRRNHGMMIAFFTQSIFLGVIFGFIFYRLPEVRLSSLPLRFCCICTDVPYTGRIRQESNRSRQILCYWLHH